MAREIAIAYGGVTLGLGADSSHELDGPYTFLVDQVRARGFLRAQVVVQHDTEATYATKEQALTTAFTTPDSTLVVTLGGTTRHTYTRAAGTGFNHRPTARKIGDADTDSRRSARWEVTVEWDLPADLYSASGRRNSRTLIDADPAGRRTVTLSGEWTRTSTNSARTQYAAQVDAWATTALAAIDADAVWELLPERSDTDQLDNLLVFTRVYSEVLATTGEAVAELRGEEFSVRVLEEGPGDTVVAGVTVGRLVQVQVAYSAFVPTAEGTGESFLSGVWLSQVRPDLIERAGVAAGSPVVAVLAQEPDLQPATNRIAATMRLLVDPGHAFLSLRVAVQDDVTLGKILEPVWDGNPWARDKHQGPGTWLKTVTVTALKSAASAATLENLFPRSVSGFELVRYIPASQGDSLGIPGDRFDLVVLSEIRLYERADLSGQESSGTREGTPLGTQQARASSEWNSDGVIP